MKPLIFCFVLLIAGCEKTVSEWNPSPAQPIPGMEGCTYQQIIHNTVGDHLHVVRCTNETVTTTYSHGKSHQSVIVDDVATTQCSQ